MPQVLAVQTHAPVNIACPVPGTRPLQKVRVLLAVMAIAVAASAAVIYADDIQQWPRLVLEFMSVHTTLGAFLFIVLFGLGTCLSIPATFPSIIAGILFKPLLLAVAIVLAGSQFGIVAAFAMGRSFLRPWVQDMTSANPKFQAVDNALSRQGWKIVLLLRLSPLFPFGICSYLLSMTSMPLWKVMAASLLGNLPGAATYSFLGSLIEDLASAHDYKVPLSTKLMTALLSLCFCTESIVFITLVARRALREALVDQESHTPPTGANVSDVVQDTSLSITTRSETQSDMATEQTPLINPTEHTRQMSSELHEPVPASREFSNSTTPLITTTTAPFENNIDPPDSIVSSLGSISEDMSSDSTPQAYGFTVIESRILFGTTLTIVSLLAIGVPLILSFTP
ncbi:hypothetical protein BASA50_006888 [Batrachochytrium salamandrivorans]|uniref:VTT domain-containing protein n=1 Tax=Batrachochytrium salamandrivorans TaxID=1357716 RepID=A0ABQ8F8C9_9FUNG|nr:hypothetical protein BASA62_002005 [Batrachochytrium salamandrivorans]KAH6593978.1 hypothetical protein BASA50_006888 [Batrachochytrium salamandrivorans]KAH9270365.1 hypothetical protein BASA83_007524 [Batrachochytrium salamandrivorans]